MRDDPITPNALDPARMTAEERFAELAEILARGLIRLYRRKSSALSVDLEESSLDLSANQWRPVKTKNKTEAGF